MGEIFDFATFFLLHAKKPKNDAEYWEFAYMDSRFCSGYWLKMGVFWQTLVSILSQSVVAYRLNEAVIQVLFRSATAH